MEDNITEMKKPMEIGMNIKGLSRDELLSYLSIIDEEITQLDKTEPKNMMSEAYEDWADDHEYLEDIRDDIIDMLETM